jgi:hypothetical protein
MNRFATLTTMLLHTQYLLMALASTFILLGIEAYVVHRQSRQPRYAVSPRQHRAAR